MKDLEEKVPFYAIRHVVKPGLTGWAQVKFPYAGTLEEQEKKLRYDLFYIKEHGPPENGVFDPVKLAKYVFVDTSGNKIQDQDHFQYGAYGHTNEAKLPDASTITNLFQGDHINPGNTF